MTIRNVSLPTKKNKAEILKPLKLKYNKLGLCGKKHI